MEDRTIRMIYGSDGCAMARRLLENADIARRIPTGSSIVLKPNLVLASPSEKGATTHTEIVEGVVQYLQEAGFGNLTIAESSWVGADTEQAFQVTGLASLADRYGLRLTDLKRDQAAPVDTPIGPIQVCRTALEADYLINLPVLKGHCQTVMTCALKNLKGCIPDQEKRRFHALGLMKPIAALAAVLKPHLTLVDSICGDLNFEEGGNPVRTGRMLLGTDPVEVDAYCCALLGLDTAQVGYLPLAEKYGAGNLRWTKEDILPLNEPVPVSHTVADGRLVRGLTRNVEQRLACSACFGSLVRALYQYREQTGQDYGGRIAIGQAFRGLAPDCLGIGQCCRNAPQYVRGCPPTAAEILIQLKKLLFLPETQPIFFRDIR